MGTKKKKRPYKHGAWPKGKSSKTKRTCLGCDRKFMSAGLWNRICPGCRKSNEQYAVNAEGTRAHAGGEQTKGGW